MPRKLKHFLIGLPVVLVFVGTLASWLALGSMLNNAVPYVSFVVWWAIISIGLVFAAALGWLAIQVGSGVNGRISEWRYIRSWRKYE